jgi:hypothetical protein
VADLRLERRLQAEVERRAPLTARHRALPSGFLEHVGGEVRRQERRRGVVHQHRLEIGPLHVLGPCEAERRHAGERDTAARAGALDRDQRVVARRGVRERSEERSLCEAQAAGVRVEIQICRGGDARRSLTQRHAVQVLLENRLLVEVQVEAPAPEDLTELPGDRARRAAQQAGQLHRDRRAAGDESPRAHILQRRAAERAHVDAVMLVEAMIFHCKKRLQQLGVEVGEAGPAAAPQGGAGGAQRQAVPVEQHDARNGAGVGERRREGQGDPTDHEQDDCCERERGTTEALAPRHGVAPSRASASRSAAAAGVIPSCSALAKTPSIVS